MTEKKSILGRLPAAYRRRDGLLRHCVQAADEILVESSARVIDEESAVRDLLHDLEGLRLPVGPDHEGASSPEVVPDAVEPSLLGTAAGLALAWASASPRPRAWPALHVEEESPGRLRFNRTWRRAVVLAWFRDEVRQEASAPETSLVTKLVPADCAVQCVWLERAPRIVPPLPGAVVRGTFVE